MKKITLGIAALLAAFTMNAQVIDSKSNSSQEVTKANQAKTFGTNTVIYDQPVDANAGSGFFSFTAATANGDGPVYRATSFELASNQNIGTIEVYGFQNNDNLSNFLTNLNLIILPNSSNDLPTIQDTPLLFIDNETINGNTFELSGNGTLIVDVENFNNGQPLNLSAGTYWLAVSPVLDATGANFLSDNGNFWFWYLGVPVDNTLPSSPYWSPADLFGDGVNVNDFGPDGETGTHLAFSMDDEGGNLAVTNLDKDKFMYYNNNEILVLSSENAINNANIYDITGKKVVTQNLNTTNANVNISNLQAGVYIAQVQVEGKTKTFKFVKK